MLKNLHDLINPTIVLNEGETPSKVELKKRSSIAREQARLQREKIDPIDLEVEFHEHLQKAQMELDHLIDILGVCAMKTKDECDYQIYVNKCTSNVLPEFIFDDEYRIIRLYWRRITEIVGKNSKSGGTIYSSRLPISKTKNEDIEAGSYPRRVFQGVEEEHREMMYNVEERFQKLRTLSTCISRIRRICNTMDRAAEKYFDDSILLESKPRIKTSKNPQEMQPEDATHVKF